MAHNPKIINSNCSNDGLGILIAKKRKKSWREMPKFLKNGHFIHGMAIINKFSWYNGRGSDVGSIWL